MLSALLLCARAARAEPDLERAKQLFEEASTLRESGHFADALVRLELAIAIKDTPGLEYHAGFCEAKLGQYVKAIDHYERAASLIRAGAAAPDVAALLNQAHKSALEHVGRLRLVLSRPVPAAVVRVDDGEVQQLSARELFLDPGKHHLLVSAQGYTSEQRDIILDAAEDMRLEVSLTPVGRDTPRPSAAPSGSAWRTASIGASLGLGALGLTTGVIAAVAHSNASASEQAARAGGEAQSARLAAAQQDKRTYATLEVVGFVTAGAGAIATVALWTLWPGAKVVSINVPPANQGPSFPNVQVTCAF